MYAMQYFEELRSITDRIDRLLPPHEEQAVIPRTVSRRGEKGGPEHAVIEAKASEIAHILPPESTWLFARKDIPTLHQGQESRRAFVQARTRLSTTAAKKVLPSASVALPPGVTLWHTSDNARRTLLLARHDLDKLFSDDPPLLPYNQDEGGIFSLPPDTQLCFRDCMILIRTKAPYLHKICWEYAGLAAHMFGVGLSDFSTLSRVLIQRLDARTGASAQLMHSRQAKYDGGPILLVSLGLPVVAHDLLPTLPPADHSRENPMRIAVPEGVMMVLDGDVRFRYSHGYPGGQEGAAVFYSITILLDSMSQTSIIAYERETRTTVMSTPMRMEHIITTRPALASQTNNETLLHRDSLWKIVQGLRLRIRSAESCLITQKYLSLQQQQEARPINDETRPGPQDS
jgi:hypothetical protein